MLTVKQDRGMILFCGLQCFSYLMFPCYICCSSSEPDAETTLDKMFDELAFKQNDSKSAFKIALCHCSILLMTCSLYIVLNIMFSAVTRPRVLNVHNRKVRLNKACGTIADCTFEELCDRVSLFYRHTVWWIIFYNYCLSSFIFRLCGMAGLIWEKK